MVAPSSVTSGSQKLIATCTALSSLTVASPEPATRLEMTSEPPIAPERAAPGKPDLNPMLRQQLHETLEKVAWEAFGDLAERIVPQVLEQVEAIAWDVIPRMAEALVEEEIRRLKGEED